MQLFLWGTRVNLTCPMASFYLDYLDCDSIIYWIVIGLYCWIEILDLSLDFVCYRSRKTAPPVCSNVLSLSITNHDMSMLPYLVSAPLNSVCPLEFNDRY